jgi:hypothetical protein
MNQILILIFSLSVLSSCQKQNQLSSLTWKTGDSKDSLNKINSIPSTQKTAGIFYKDQKIEFSAQSIDNSAVEDTFIKKSISANDDIRSAEAVFYDPANISIRKKTEKNINVFKLIEKINHISAPRKLKNYQLNKVYAHLNNGLEAVNSFQYELGDGTLWLAQFNNDHILLNNKKLGSGFTTTQANVFLKGPKFSSLTDITLKDLDTAPTISNSNIFVDSEATKKIMTIESLLKFDPKDERFDQLQVFYYLDTIQNWMKTKLSVRFPEKLIAVVNVGFPNKTNTAFYYQNKIRLGRGDDITYTMIASDASIVYHESFHALIDGLAHLPYENEGGSMNEGFADFFTCVALNSPYLGESSYVKGPYKRSVITFVRLDEKSGGLYHDSAIISGLLWEMKEKLNTEKSLAIATETLSMLNPYSTFSDFNKSFISVMQKKLNTDDRQAVSLILKNRGFIYE